MRHRLVLFVDKKEDRLDTFVVNVRRLKKAAKRLKTVKVNENFFFIFPALCRFPSKFKTILQTTLRILLSTTTKKLLLSLRRQTLEQIAKTERRREEGAL